MYTILCVDDEPIVLRTLEDALRRDYRVLKASSGSEAIELVSRLPVDLVIADYRMHGMTGVSLLRQLQWRFPRVRRVLISGMLEQVRDAGLLDGELLHGCLAKPWTFEELHRVIIGALALLEPRAWVQHV